MADRSTGGLVPALRRAARGALAALALAGLVAAPASPGLAQQRYVRVAPSADGIGKVYMGREIARVMGWQGAAWLERAEREQEERPSLLIEELALQAGMVVADVGAGTGFHARRVAARVGPTGVVYATDLQPQMLRFLEELARRPGLENLRVVASTPTEAGLAPASVDLALMVDVYHEFDHPFEMLASIVRAVRPGGRVAFVEFRAEDPRVPIRALHKMSEAQIRREAEVHGLVWERTFAGLPWQHLVVFRRPAR